MTTPGIVIEREGAIATVRLDRPDRHNSVTFQMWQALETIFTDLGTDKELRGVILTGSGKSFSAGADISDFEQTRGTPEQGITYEVAVDAACDAIAALGVPVIAAIRGYCYGGACNLAMACDFRFVAPDVKFAIPAAKLSIVYSARGMTRLVSLVGLAEAKRVFYTARPFDAERAIANGFADELVADPVLAARSWLDETARLAPLSLAGSKAILNMAAMTDKPFDAELAHKVTYRALTSTDYVE
ncbi:MAG TPA: enoyl-CoA hydratase-related protein, partial [Rhodanobacteraceae bacterium]|nr:enoyl-CoA hydratase-related protein [Rhodanobacteraceae bacterium]